MTAHGRAVEYLEGTLGPDDEAAFLDHVTACAACQAALTDDVQLRELEELAQRQPGRAQSVTARAAARTSAAGDARPRRDADVIPIESRRRWKVISLAALPALAVAAAVMLWIVPREPAVPGGSTTLALAPTRSIETRIGHPAAASYRPYDVPRGPGAPRPGVVAAGRESIPAASIARLERARDCRGVAAAHVLNGELVRAGDVYATCAAGADLDADRAGLAVLLRQPEEALRIADRALAERLDHPVALWNRALALRDLGLGLAAAEDFDRVAELDPAWAKEARERAAALRSPLNELRDSSRRVLEAGAAMVAGGPPIPADLARRHPARARTAFHHAIRTARSTARLLELRPLAAALEGLAGDGLARYLDQAAAGLTPARLALVDDYAAMVKNQAAPDEARFRAWLERARAARADDLVLGALEVTVRIGDAAEEATRLAAATGDPWFELAVLVQRAMLALEADRLAEVAPLLDEGDRRCAAGGHAYRCLQLKLERALLEIKRYHPAVARELTVASLREATALGEWQQRLRAAHLAAEAERFREELAAARGFYREAALGEDNCLARRRTTAVIGEMSFDEHRLAEARAAVASLPDCGTPPRLVELVLEGDLLRAGAPVRDRAALLADLAAARDRAEDATRSWFDYLIARAELGHAADAPARLRAIAVAARARPPGTDAARAGMGAAQAALVDAGARGAWSEVLAIAAEAQGVPVPRRCAAVVGADDFQMVGAAIGPAGEITGVYLRDLVQPAEWLAPAALRERVRGCEVVDVLALPPWLGVGPLLDPAVSWRYVLGAPRAPAPGAPRRVIIADPKPPNSLGLPPLAPWTVAPAGAELITGAAATPERLAAVARDATILEIHAHTDRVPSSDAPALALSEGRTGWAVTAEEVRKLRLDRAPVVVLADCVGAVPARYAHTSWGLPASFLGAGARAVVAALAPIPDAAATAFFAGVVADVERGNPVATAVARARAAYLAHDPKSWARHVVVFE